MEHRPKPVPGANEVLIKVAYAGVNRHDCNQRARGHAPPGATDILGLEVSGSVIAVGSAVNARRIGEQVCALINGGGYAEYAVADAKLALPIPDHLDLRQAAAVPEAAFTCWLNLMELCGLRRSQTLLIHGGASGIGTFASQMATDMGVCVLATASTTEKCELARGKGAAACFNYKTDDVVQHVMDYTRGQGVDAILDMSGGQYTRQNLAMLKFRGTITHLTPGGHSEVGVPLGDVMRTQAKLTGALLRPLPAVDKYAIADKLMVALWPKLGAAITPTIDGVIPLDRAFEAHQRLESGNVLGKLILSV